jgi:ketosteroid isomerase-like protein
MKLSALCLSALLFAGLAAHAHAAPKSDILKLEDDFNAAYFANDLDKYFAFYADDAILWFPEGRTDIPSYKKEWAEFIKSGGGIQEGSMSDMHVRFSPLGDTAIASYLLHLKTRQADKKVLDEVYQESDVWFKAAGGWKIAHVHYAPATPPAHK